MKVFFKRYWLIVIALSVFLCSIVCSFYQYFDKYYQFSPLYYEELENCLHKASVEECIQKGFISPDEQLKREESRDLYFKIVSEYQIYIAILMPLLICLIVVGLFHSDFHSGNIKNILIRESLKKFYFQMQKKIFLWNLLFLFVLPVMFLICSVITGFNFKLLDHIFLEAQYFEWNYQHFGIYLFVHSLLLYLVGLLYSQIVLLFIYKSENKLLTIVFSFLGCFCYLVFIELGVYALFCTNLLHLSNVHPYFNLLGIWWLVPEDSNYFLLLISYFLQMILIFGVVRYGFSSREKVFIRYEKEVR